MENRETKLDKEIRFHFEQQVETLMAQGLTRPEAERRARLEFGGIEQVKEECRESRAAFLWHTTMQDLRYGLRMLWKSPAFTAIAVLSLALGIGANTAIFSVIDALLLRNLAVRNPEQLVMLTKVLSGDPQFTFQLPDLDRYRALTQVFADIGAVVPVDRSGITVDNGANGTPTSDDASVRIGLVSGGYFSTMGAGLQMGRAIAPDDDQGLGGNPVAVISHGYWQRKLGLDPSVVGRTFTLNGMKYTILGVTAKDFTGDWVGRPFDMWIPVSMIYQVMPELPPGGRGSRLNFRFIARLRPGVTNAQAQTVSQGVLEQLQKEGPAADANEKVTLRLDSMARGYSPQRDMFRQPLAILMAMVAAVLLIACANVANLLLARSTARRREIAVRLAIGAGRARIIRQLLVESLLLAVAGGVLGLLFALWGANALTAFVRSGPAGGLTGLASIDLDLHFDGRILAFDLALCFLTGIVFGLAPAWRGSNVALSPALSKRGAESGAAGRFHLRNLLVVAQVGVSLVLLCGMGLFLRSLHNLRSESLGFERDRLLLVWTRTGETGRPPAGQAALFEEAQRRISGLPGVVSASPSVYGILAYSSGGDGPPVTADGYTLKPNEDPRAYFHIVGPRFFETAGIQLLEGRDFNERDDMATQKVAIISQSMARYFFGNASPLGRHVRANFGNNPPLLVVGVVADAKSNSMRDHNHMTFYYPVRQQIGMRLIRMCLVVRTAGPPTAVAASVRQTLRQIDSRLPILRIDTVDEQVDDMLAQERLIADLSLCFGIAAVLLACLGLYGVISYTVVQRTGELGIRMALGAQRSQVLGMILRESLVLTLSGVAMGVPAALAVAPTIANRLFQVGPSDPATIGVAALLMIIVAIVAGAIPAMRASRVDPMVALRYE